MSTFVYAGTNANHFLEEALEVEDTTSVDFPGILTRYGVHHLMSETSESELNDLSTDLPTDTHLVTFRTKEGAVSCDAVRAFTKCDIFDGFTDSGVEVIKIQSGFGSIKPALYATQSKEKK